MRSSYILVATAVLVAIVIVSVGCQHGVRRLQQRSVGMRRSCILLVIVMLVAIVISAVDTL